MKVYILIEKEEHYDEISGVFSSQEKAEDAQKQLEDDDEYEFPMYGFKIIERTLDAIVWQRIVPIDYQPKVINKY